MSRFYASIQGNRGGATRQGTTNSEMSGHVRGWHVGAKVYMLPQEEDGSKDQVDAVQIYLSGGSTGCHSDVFIGKFTQEDLQKKITVFVDGEERT